MANTTEEIMLTLSGRDEASQMFANVDKNAQSMASNISSAMSKVNTGLMSLGQVTDNVMQSLTGKSAMDNIFGTASKAETNMVLLENMLEDSEKNFDSFYKTVDSTTDQSLTSMQELIPALNALNAATGATDKELQNITPNVANFGAAVLAQTGSVDRAQQAMMDLSKGYKGAYASLDQYGITEDALAREGFNEGDSIEKYMEAVTKVIGSTEKLMETNQGLDALIGKSFSRAGKKIGNEYLPIIKDLKKGFIDLDNEMDGAIASTILLGSAGIESGNRVAWNISTAVQGARDLADAFRFVTQAIRGTEKAAESASDAINMASNISDVGAGAAGIGAAGAGADIAKTTSKSEKAFEGGMDALLMADMLKDKDADTTKWLRDAEKSDKKTYDKLKKYNEESAAKRAAALTDGKYDKALKNIRRDTSGLEEALKMSTDSKLYDEALKEWEATGQTFTGALKGKIGGFKNKITGALSSIRSFDLAGTISSPFKSMINNIKGFSFGGALQSSLEKSLGGLGNIASTIKGKFTSFGSSIAGLKDIDIGAKLKGLDTSVYQKIKGFSFKDTLSGLKESIGGLRGTAEVIDEASDIGKTLEGAGDIAEGMGAAAAAGTAAAEAGPAMEAGAAGAAGASAGATSLSAAFTGMIVPMLALSATIIIMIPIMGVIAAEAMIVIRLLAELMEALNFDSINLDGAIKGISQVATALAWVGAAMLALVAVNITTQLAAVTSMFLGMTGPLDVAVNAIKDAASKLSQFNTTGFDPNIANNIKAVADALGAVSNAMGALTWSNITTGFSNFIAGALGFSSVTEGLEQAKNDIIQASSKLSEFSGMATLDDSVAQNIQNVCNSLASVGDAMGALRGIRDSQNWDDIIGGLIGGIFGEGVDIQTALMNVKDDIIKASEALAQFTGISEIPEGVAEKIQKVSDTLKSVNDAFTSLRGLRDDSNWDAWMEGIFGGTDIASALETIKTDLMTASQKLAELSGLSEIDESVGEKITKVNDTLTKVGEVATALTGLPPMDGFDPATITTAVTNVQTAATELAKLNETVFDGSTADTVLGSIQTTLENVKSTLASASGFTEAATGVGSQIVTGVQTGLSSLGGIVQGAVSSGISSASGTATTGGNTLGTNATDGMKSTLQLKSIMETEVGYALTALTSKEQEFYDAGAKLGAAAKRGLESTKAINPGSPGNLAHIMMDEVGYILEAITSKYGVAYNLAAGLGRSIYQGFGNPSLDMDMFTNGGQLTAEHIGALKTTISRPPDKTDNRPVTVIVQEGAVNVDARNHTVKEAQGLMITALEGMDHITNIDVDGV